MGTRESIPQLLFPSLPPSLSLSLSLFLTCFISHTQTHTFPVPLMSASPAPCQNRPPFCLPPTPAEIPRASPFLASRNFPRPCKQYLSPPAKTCGAGRGRTKDYDFLPDSRQTHHGFTHGISPSLSLPLPPLSLCLSHARVGKIGHTWNRVFTNFCSPSVRAVVPCEQP